MAQYTFMLLMVLVAVMSQRLTVADEQAPPIPATADPCVLGAVLAVHYKNFGDDCGETVSLDLVYSDGKPTAVSYDAAEQSKFYTLMMVDPDAPEAVDPKFAYYLHWLIINIQGGDLINGVYVNGSELTSYQDPLPQLESGLHRYQFFVFAQAGTLDINSPHGRPFFDVGAFIVSNSLTGPLAGYQFRTEETEFVPTTHSDSTVQGSTGSTSESSTGSTTAPSPIDGVTASTPAAGASILKGNWVMLVILALFAVFQLAR